MRCVYPNTELAMLKNGITKKVMAAKLGISERCLDNKLNGKTAFTWKEVETLQKVFFADMSKEEIMRKKDDPAV